MTAARGNVSVSIKRGVVIALIRSWDSWLEPNDAGQEQAAHILSEAVSVTLLSPAEVNTYYRLLAASRIGVERPAFDEFMAFVEEWEGCGE